MSRSGKLIATNDHWIYQLIDDPDYIVHPDGRVLTRIAKTGKRYVDPNVWRDTVTNRPAGHQIVRYKYKHLQLARIVYAIYKGKLEPDLVIYHKDWDISNNHVDNLVKGTQSENNHHHMSNPNRKHTIRKSKLDFEIAESIRLDNSNGIPYSTLIEKYGLCKSTISYVINQKTWKRSVHTPNKVYNY